MKSDIIAWIIDVPVTGNRRKVSIFSPNAPLQNVIFFVPSDYTAYGGAVCNRPSSHMEFSTTHGNMR